MTAPPRIGYDHDMISINRNIIALTTDARYTDAAAAMIDANPRSTADERAYALARLIDMIIPD